MTSPIRGDRIHAIHPEGGRRSGQRMVGIVWQGIRRGCVDQYRTAMASQTHIPPQHGPLHENQRTDMPAARTLIVIVVALLAVFSVVAAVIYYNAQEEAPPLRPGIEQEAPVP